MTAVEKRDHRGKPIAGSIHSQKFTIEIIKDTIRGKLSSTRPDEGK
jgi:hypothetical protein